MELFITILLAASAAGALMCITQLVMIYTERATETVRTADILHSELSEKIWIRLLLRAAGLLLLAASIAGAAVIYDGFFFSTETPVLPVLLLAASALLIFLLTRHIRHVHYLILCCAMQAAKRQHEINVANSNNLQ